MGRILLSICAVVVAVGLGGPAAVNGQPVELAHQATGQGTGNAEDRTPLAVTLVESEHQAKSAEKREAKSDEHERLDLKAQQKAANAAYFAALFSGLGTLLIVGALVQTSLANMRQMRAYVGVDKIRATEREDGGLEFGVVIHNFGQTPAYRFDGHFTVFLGDTCIPNLTIYPPQEIMPQHHLTMATTLGHLAVPRVLKGELSFRIQGGGSYRDLAGRKRTMQFSMVFHPETQSLIAAGGDNRSD